MPDAPLLLSFPELLPQSRRQAVPGLRFVDPGLSLGDDPESLYTPRGLPLDRDTARLWLAQATGYAGMFEPGDLRTAEAAAKAGTSEDRWGDPTRQIIDDLLAMGRGAAPSGASGRSGADADAQGGADNQLLRAQSVLLLAWERERGLADAGASGQDYEGVLGRFAESLGLEPDEVDDVPGAPGLGLARDEALYGAPGDWRPLLGAMLRLLPPDAVLCTDNPSVAETWADEDVPLAPATAEELAALAPGLEPGPWLAGRCPGWRLLGRAHADEDQSWLSAERVVLALAPAARGGDA